MTSDVAPISDVDKERLRLACIEGFPLSHDLVRALIARLDAAERMLGAVVARPLEGGQP